MKTTLIHNMGIHKPYVLLILAFIAMPTLAAEMRSLKSVNEAVKLAESIPVNGVALDSKNVAQRMQAAGITITGGRKYSYDSKAELERPIDKVGDIHFTINATEPSEDFKQHACDMWGEVSFMMRGGKYYPESRAANWLMTGKCSTDYLKPAH